MCCYEHKTYKRNSNKRLHTLYSHFNLKTEYRKNKIEYYISTYLMKIFKNHKISMIHTLLKTQYYLYYPLTTHADYFISQFGSHRNQCNYIYTYLRACVPTNIE